ncbi:MAG: radical SAM protein, partial [Deltaproteobacteria bacterium]|nr:radical SAM protein [Deltaproteobacteria bacterium]
MKVLLINPNRSPGHSGGYYKESFAQMPPITLACLAAVLEKAGVEVDFYDDVLGRGDRGELEAAIRGSGPDVVGLSVVTAVMPGVPRVVKTVREVDPNIKVVCGNIHADFFHESFLREGLADVVVHGEGEDTFVDLVRTLGGRDPDLSNVKGISFLRDGALVTTESRPFIEDLDSLPYPAWHLFPMDRYRIFSFARVKDPGILILGSRGCPFRCSYCSLKIMGASRRHRSVENIAGECEFMYDRFGYVQPSFVDPIFPFGKKEALDYAGELIRRGLHKKQVWITETRTDLVDLESLQALRESGLRRVMFGIETGDGEELASLRKGSALDKTLKAVAACRKAGVDVVGFFMLGVPGATRESMQKSIDFAKELDLDFAKYTVFVPYPGTPLYDELISQGRIREPEDWDRYSSYPTKDRPPIYVPDGLTADDIIGFQRKAHLSFYLRPRMVYRQL